jgi:hypothetical protein
MTVTLICPGNVSSSDLSATDDMGPPPDAAGSFGAACDITSMTSCHSGLHCSSTPNGDQCIPDPANPIPAGSPCTSISFGAVIGDFCAPGSQCVAYDGVSVCRVGCFQHSDCANGGFCVAPTASSATMRVPGLGMQSFMACVDDTGCDPVLQLGCDPGTTCYFSGADDIGRARICDTKHGSAPPGTSCMSHRDCAPGETCSGLGFCRQLCYRIPVDTDGGTVGGCTDSTTTCNPFFGSGDNYGICE